MKKNCKTNKDPMLPACIDEIDELMDDLKRLTDNSTGFRQLKREWTGLKASLLKKGVRSHSEKTVQKTTTAGGRSKKTAARSKGAKGATRYENKVHPEMGLGYGMGVKNMKAELAHAKSGRTDDPASVSIQGHTLTCYLGSFPIEELAKRDAAELLSHPQVFWYRRALFPDPTASKVQPRITSTKVVERKAARFTRAPYTVRVEIDIQGDPAHCMAWAEGVVNRNKGDQE